MVVIILGCFRVPQVDYYTVRWHLGESRGGWDLGEMS